MKLLYFCIFCLDPQNSQLIYQEDPTLTKPSEHSLMLYMTVVMSFYSRSSKQGLLIDFRLLNALRKRNGEFKTCLI